MMGPIRFEDEAFQAKVRTALLERRAGGTGALDVGPLVPRAAAHVARQLRRLARAIWPAVTAALNELGIWAVCRDVRRACCGAC